nr:MAG TPA: hypothetical protein [Caudoviricetes sp.]
MSWITLDNLKRFWKNVKTNPITFSGEINLQNTTRYKGQEIATKADVAAGSNKITVDSALSDTSTNPVQNKVIKAEVQKWKDAYNNLRKRSVPASFEDATLTQIHGRVGDTESISLSQPYTDFDGLFITYKNVYYSDDSGSYGGIYGSTYISTAELQRRISAGQFPVSLVDGTRNMYWAMSKENNNGDKVSTTFFPYYESAGNITSINGVKFNDVT